MGRVSSLKTSMLELSSQETKICRHAQEVWIETTRRFIQVSWRLGPCKSNDCDPWNGTTRKTYFLFLTVWNRTQRVENTGKTLESSASRRWENLCFFFGVFLWSTAYIFVSKKETFVQTIRKVFRTFLYFPSVSVHGSLDRTRCFARLDLIEKRGTRIKWQMSLREGLHNTTMRECGFTRGSRFLQGGCSANVGCWQNPSSPAKIDLVWAAFEIQVAYRWHLDLGGVSGAVVWKLMKETSVRLVWLWNSCFFFF